MGNIKYILTRLKKMDYKAMGEKVKTVSKKTGKSKLSVFIDMSRCAKKYGAGYMDYDLFEMYSLTPEQRETYITRGRNAEIVRKYNKPDYFHIFENKNEFNLLFKNYIKRDWIDIEDTRKEDVINFLNKHENFMAKPKDGGCGKGIEKINTGDYKNVEELYNYLSQNEQKFELEEIIKQHESVNNIHPNSINTVRVVTILKDNIPHIICAYFRIGNGKHVDNFNSGGMVTPVDVETGIVLDKAIDKNKNLYEVHPLTGAKIKGFQFPNWNEALEMCREAATIVPQMGYIGWDVAFTPNGPVFVEGNEYPGHDIYQLPEHTPDKMGMMPKFNI